MFLAAILILRFAGGLDHVAQAKGVTLFGVDQEKKPYGKNIYSLKTLDAKCSKGTMDVLNGFRLKVAGSVMSYRVHCYRGFDSNAPIADFNTPASDAGAGRSCPSTNRW